MEKWVGVFSWKIAINTVRAIKNRIDKIAQPLLKQNNFKILIQLFKTNGFSDSFLRKIFFNTPANQNGNNVTSTNDNHNMLREYPKFLASTLN